MRALQDALTQYTLAGGPRQVNDGAPLNETFILPLASLKDTGALRVYNNVVKEEAVAHGKPFVAPVGVAQT